MSAATYHELSVDVPGGALHVGVWEPTDAAASVLLIHGITASHRAWQHVAPALSDVRLIAPDLRGRGRSHAVAGPAGLAAHAKDLVAVLDAAGVARATVIGHSMGAFVAVVLAQHYPDRVERLVLVDGGLPLDVPAGLDAAELAALILGPTAARLSMRFASVDDYLDFWRGHPAFLDTWSAELEEYFAYDLVDDGEGQLRPATSAVAMLDDTLDMNSGPTLPAALAALRHPTALITVPRGLRDEEPGLYAPAHLERQLARYPGIRHERMSHLNHYTIVMSPAGAEIVARTTRREWGLAD